MRKLISSISQNNFQYPISKIPLDIKIPNILISLMKWANIPYHKTSKLKFETEITVNNQLDPALTIEPNHERTCFCHKIMRTTRRRSASASAQSDQRFGVRCLDSSFYIRNVEPLPCFCGCAGWFVSYLVENPGDRFSRDGAQLRVDETAIHLNK